MTMSSSTMTETESAEVKETVDVHTVQKLDLNRFLGKWYEIARFDHRFERDMEGVTADYSKRPDGKIRVINSGYIGGLDGKYKAIEGKAKQPDPADPGKLKVSFFLWFYADYYVLELDQVAYSCALIGSSTDKYLWILSRTPQLDDKKLQQLLDDAKERGYDTSKLIWVKQKK